MNASFRRAAIPALLLATAQAAGLGPMARKPFQPFEETFEDEDLEAWEVKADAWRVRRGKVIGQAQGNGWLRLKNRTFDDFVLEVDVQDAGQAVGFAYGVVFRKVGRYELMFMMSTQSKYVGLRTVSYYKPQPRGSIPGVKIHRGFPIGDDQDVVAGQT